MGDLASRLRADGIRGVGQTSWGPTLFALLPDSPAAESLVARLAATPLCENCTLHLARPKNVPAQVLIEA
jgi:predicted sugar kinase